MLGAADFYHEHTRWYVRLLLLMPDHLHALVAFPIQERMTEVVRNLKSYTARNQAIAWQRGFFDHRLRDNEQMQLKAEYIRQNPVRKGLIETAEQWPYFIEH